MAQIAHSFVEQTTRQVVTGTTYTTVLSSPSGNFVAGGKYLVIVKALTDLAVGATDHIKARVLHGATPFAESEQIIEPTNALKRYTYWWRTVWTAVSGEAINFQIACSAAADVGADQISVFAMRLDVDLVENVDWFWNELATDGALGLTPLDGASVTFTPPVSTNWLVSTCAQLDVNSLTASYGTQMVPSGTYSDVQPAYRREGEDTAELFVPTLWRVFEDVGAISHTFKEQAFNTQEASGNRLHSSVFAMNINKFRNFAIIADPSEELLGTILWDDLLASISYTPEVATDVLAMVFGTFVPVQTGAEITHRLTIDDVDQPPTQTTDQYAEEEPADATDELSVGRQTLEVAMTAALHTFNWEAESSLTTQVATIKNRMMLVMSMELGGNVPSVAKIAMEILGYVLQAVSIPYEIGKRIRDHQALTKLATRGVPFAGWVAGLVQDSGVGTLPLGTIEEGQNFVPLPAGKYETRGGSRLILTLKDDQGSPAELSHVLALIPKAQTGAVSIGWSDPTDKHYAHALTSDIAFAGASEALSRTAFPSTWTKNAPARPVSARLFERLYVCDAEPSYANRATMVAIDTQIPPVITEPTFAFVTGGAGAAALRPYCLEEYNNVLFIAGYGDEESDQGDRPETVRHSFLGTRPDLAGGFDPLAFNVIGAQGERVTAMKKGRGLLLIAKPTELYRLSGFGRRLPGWQYQVEPIFNTDGFGVSNALGLEHAEGWWYGAGKQGPFRTDGFNVQSLVGPRQRAWARIDKLEFSWVRYNPSRRLVLFGVHFEGSSAGHLTYPFTIWAFDIDRNVWTGDQVYLRSLAAGDVLDVTTLATISTETVQGPSGTPSAPNTTAVNPYGWTANWTNGDSSPGAQTEYWEKEGSNGDWFLKAVVPAIGADDFTVVVGRLNHSTYFWKVRHVKAGRFSEYSAEVMVKTLLEPPALSTGQGSGFTGTVPGTLHITNGNNGLVDIVVEQSFNNGASWIAWFTELSKAKGTYTFSPISPAKWVRAKVRDNGWTPTESGYSATVIYT